MAGPRYAGQYGPEGIELPDGRPAINNPVTVMRTDGSPAQLYADKSKSVLAPNPVRTDGMGNLRFFAAPGEYGLLINGSMVGVLVPIHPDDPAIGEDIVNPVVDWFNGDGPPDVIVGAGLGDMYFDRETGALYQNR